MTDFGNADRRLVAFYGVEYGKYCDTLEEGLKDAAAIRKVRCDVLRELIKKEAHETRDATEAKAKAFDILNETLFGYGDVLLKTGRAPCLTINNEPGTEVSITGAAAKALLEAGVPEWE